MTGARDVVDTIEGVGGQNLHRQGHRLVIVLSVCKRWFLLLDGGDEAEVINSRSR